MQKAYKTVYKEGCYTLEEKRSRFIARVKPISSEEEAIDFINRVRSESPDASHHCYAYHVAGESTYQRYSDDGEPAGTAGLPILEVINKRGLSNTVIVVTRYFGGILLGAGGLLRAYGKAAAGGVSAAGEIYIKSCLEAQIRVEYHLSGRLQNMLLNEGHHILDTDYSDIVTYTAIFYSDRKHELENRINEVTGGKADIVHSSRERSVKIDGDGNLLEVM